MCFTLGNSKFGGYCLRCYQHYNPEAKISINYRIKETAWAKFLQEAFPDVNWVFNKTIRGGSSRCRPDAFADLGNYCLVCENDEHQHDCTRRRREILRQDAGNRIIVFLHFNPDDYKTQDGKKVTTCWGTDKEGRARVKPSKEKEWGERLEAYGECVDYYLRTTPQKEVTIEYFFYDECD